LTGLEELGLVKRCADPEDRRMWRLQLTPAAVPLVRHIKTLRAKLFLVGTKGINASALGIMAAVLRQLKENVSSQRLDRHLGKERHDVQSRPARTASTASRAPPDTAGSR
jgi:hypothetical protein